MKRTFLFLLFTTALLSPNLIAREVPDALSNSEGDVERDTPISIVILPSIVSQRATLEQRASADLWADQLSQQLESARGITSISGRHS